MSKHTLAGKPAPENILANIPSLVSSYYIFKPDATIPSQAVSFGTSGHRGSSLKNSFNQNHILAISQAICEYRKKNQITGPLFLGMDTHALSTPAIESAIRVFVANGIRIKIDKNFGYTPTPVISHAILTYNKELTEDLADGVVITPSHNPPEDGGFKYNMTHGGPADSKTTAIIEKRANKILHSGLKDVLKMDYEDCLNDSHLIRYDYITPFVDDLKNVINMDAIRESGIKIGVDPMGGSGIRYWKPIAEKYGLNLTVVNDSIDPTFRFMSVDHDGKIRMDCSSPFAMANLIKLKNDFDIAFGNDTDFDRHGIVTPTEGLMNPNHYLAVAIKYLFETRSNWKKGTKIGKTLVSSSMIDRVAEDSGIEVSEVPVGFKWFVDGLYTGEFGFGGEESAGASFLRFDGSAWSTDKDGIIMNLLAAEITAVTGKNPSEHYKEFENKFGKPIYERLDAAATSSQKNILKNLDADAIKSDTFAGEQIIAKLTHAPGNGAAIGGLKVVTQNGWFAARPSGTEDIYKIYAESFKGVDHLKMIQKEAQELINTLF